MLVIELIGLLNAAEHYPTANEKARVAYLDKRAQLLHRLIDATGAESSRYHANQASEEARNARASAEVGLSTFDLNPYSRTRPLGYSVRTPRVWVLAAGTAGDSLVRADSITGLAITNGAVTAIGPDRGRPTVLTPISPPVRRGFHIELMDAINTAYILMDDSDQVVYPLLVANDQWEWRVRGLTNVAAGG
ncbi:hypothetical protein [Streptomyces harbinensis]